MATGRTAKKKKAASHMLMGLQIPEAQLSAMAFRKKKLTKQRQQRNSTPLRKCLLGEIHCPLWIQLTLCSQFLV